MVMAQRMHCQCCGRPILANMGVIAHHGFERPRYGQTPSCFGARKLPFEVARDALGLMIEGLKNSIDALRKARAEVAAGHLGDRKVHDLRDHDGRIRMQTEFLAEQEARFAGWQQTHKRAGGDWVKL